MCGIVGILALRSGAAIDPQEGRTMSGQLVHRGPDGEAEFFNDQKNVYLGFRRLAIIDLNTGMQPIANEDGSIRVICNGEIYNFRRLRAELEKQGHSFSSVGDIEPLVHLYEEHGTKFLEHVDGFFALAVADERRKKVVLAVDRMGKKPLYYTVVRDRLFFASELKSLQAVLPERTICKSSVIDYLRFGYIPAPATIFDGIFKLPPGHYLEIERERSVGAPVRYFEFKNERFSGNYASAKAELNELMVQAVEKRLVADVPVGVLLSGGLDSSIVTAIATRSLGKSIKTFSVGFKSELYNELPLARMVAERYRTDHTELTVEPDLQAMLETVVGVYDEPFADSSAIPTTLICREAAKHVRVVLTGDGGDEAFCGYDRYRGFALGSALNRVKIGALLVRFWCAPGGEQRSGRARAWRFLRGLNLPPGQRYSDLMRVYYEDQLEALLGLELNKERQKREDWVAGAVGSSSTVEAVNRCDLLTYLPGDLLVKIDRASMAGSLETRAPFLDRFLVEYALSLPTRYKVGLKKGKKIVRDTFGDLLPGALLRAPKRGFGVPMGQWLRGALKIQMMSMLNADSVMVREGFVRLGCLNRLINEHINEQFDHSARLWSLMVLERFLKS